MTDPNTKSDLEGDASTKTLMSAVFVVPPSPVTSLVTSYLLPQNVLLFWDSVGSDSIVGLDPCRSWQFFG